jgi:outer membrane immunogenic protein
MRITRINWTVLLMIVVLASGAVAEAQQSPAANSTQSRPELALTYTYLRANAPPGQCGCFNLNGGSAQFIWPTPAPGVALAGDVTVSHANSIGSSASSLTLSSFTAGVHYSPPLKETRYQPYGQVLIGYGHISGSLIQGQTSGSSNGFAANLGGGLDARISQRVSLRLIEADYLVTTFTNGVNDHQNLLRLSAGIVVRF